MRYVLFLLIFFASFSNALEPCAKKKCKAIPGTNTIVITISMDEEGNPLPSVTELLELKPGQRIVFTGPEEFIIFFKDQKTPFKKSEFKSKDGVVTIKIPEKIFEDKRFFEESYRDAEIAFNYGVRVNGREFDPPLIVKKED
ncbi:MAG TPA: hypothetical protein VL995_08355 [Cellvibrio sp.]|nr:hypothetical protein [Cellvibrio sp.]